jgi:outer membrane protein OmpA-like peptidoglycan-associated protein
MRLRCTWLLGVPLFLTATPANACFPPAIGFARGSAALDARARGEIDRLAAEFRRSPRGSRLDLESIGDTVGPADLNRRMARRRAEVVRAAFVRRGVPDGVIDIQLSVAGNGWAREVWINIPTRPGCV